MAAAAVGGAEEIAFSVEDEAGIDNLPVAWEGREAVQQDVLPSSVRVVFQLESSSPLRGTLAAVLARAVEIA